MPEIPSPHTPETEPDLTTMELEQLFEWIGGNGDITSTDYSRSRASLVLGELERRKNVTASADELVTLQLYYRRVHEPYLASLRWANGMLALPPADPWSA